MYDLGGFLNIFYMVKEELFRGKNHDFENHQITKGKTVLVNRPSKHFISRKYKFLAFVRVRSYYLMVFYPKIGA